jgi:hypothetical protein
MSAITAILAALCLCPSARDPPRGRTFVENKSQSAIQPNGDRAVEALFLSFLPVESVLFCRSFHPCNPRPTHDRQWVATFQKLRGARPPRFQLVIVLRQWPEARALSAVEGERAAASRTIQVGEAHFAAFCLHLSARDPTRIFSILVAKKALSQFDA